MSRPWSGLNCTAATGLARVASLKFRCFLIMSNSILLNLPILMMSLRSRIKLCWLGQTKSKLELYLNPWRAIKPFEMLDSGIGGLFNMPVDHEDAKILGPDHFRANGSHRPGLYEAFLNNMSLRHCSVGPHSSRKLFLSPMHLMLIWLIWAMGFVLDFCLIVC